jgi:hypothetical protein
MKAYFEVMMDSQEVAKTVLRSPGILHSVSWKDYIFDV